MVRTVVLGRFQPFHCGHEGVVNAALLHAGSDDVMIAIGSWQPRLRCGTHGPLQNAKR